MRRKRRIFGVAIALAVAAWFWRLAPDPLFAEPESSVLLARDGQLLGARIASDGQWRFPAAAAVPLKYRQALIEFEDRRFEQHPGIDPIANGVHHLQIGALTVAADIIALANFAAHQH